MKGYILNTSAPYSFIVFSLIFPGHTSVRQPLYDPHGVRPPLLGVALLFRTHLQHIIHRGSAPNPQQIFKLGTGKAEEPDQ